MDIFPIWKTTYYTSNAQEAVFRIVKDGEVIYRARARRMPDESALLINLNKACQSTLDSILIPSDTEDSVERQNAYAEFKLQTLNETSGQWVDTYDFAFYNDWSYDPQAPADCLNAPINAHAAPGQIITLTQLVTGESYEICYEIICPDVPGPTPPTPTPSPDYLYFSYGASGFTIATHFWFDSNQYGGYETLSGESVVKWETNINPDNLIVFADMSGLTPSGASWTYVVSRPTQTGVTISYQFTNPIQFSPAVINTTVTIAVWDTRTNPSTKVGEGNIILQAGTSAG